MPVRAIDIRILGEGQFLQNVWLCGIRSGGEACRQIKTLTVSASKGRVELQDEAGKPLPGYTFEDAVSVDRNGVAQEVWWRGDPDVGSLSGRPVRMRVTMRSAKLYAFQFEESSL